jgi:hypothetical protein
MREALGLALASVLGIVPIAVPEDSCPTSEVSITWGFKESFRSYISGAIAQGAWEVSGDVGYEIPEFTFTGGSGFVAPDRSDGVVSFSGGIVFRGHDGILETSLQDPELVFAGPGEALLVIDVTGVTMDEQSVRENDVPFARVTWGGASESIDQAGGIWQVDGAEVVLSESGSEAFGTYPAGEVMDPMSFTLVVDPGCLDQGGLSFWWIPGGAVAIVAAVGALAFAIRRGRK